MHQQPSLPWHSIEWMQPQSQRHCPEAAKANITNEASSSPIFHFRLPLDICYAGYQKQVS